MSLVEAFVFLSAFLMIYGSLMIVAWAVDKVLRYTCNTGLFPKDYFK
jgi:hypothetical protein